MKGVSRETVRRRLAEDDLKPWRRDMWCIARVDGTYVVRMEDVLDLYAEGADPKRPVVCFDESPTQLIGEVREPIPAEPGQPERYDCEYRRNGTANLFVFLDAHRSWRHVKVTDQRTTQDFAMCMRDRADIHYPHADQIRVVMDNLSTHTVGALYEAFPAPEAHRIVQRLAFQHTPKHASWLNMVEIEIGVLRGQCLDRHIGERAYQMEVHHAEGTPEAGPRLSKHRQRVEITVTRYQCATGCDAPLPASVRPGPSGHKRALTAKLARHRGGPKMTIIDSQVHAYEANTPKRPWHNVPNWPDHVTGDEMVAAMDKVGVDGAIFISAFGLYRYDGSYATEVQRAHPDRFAIIKPVDPDDPNVADVIADWKKTPGTVGIRIMLPKESGRKADDPGFDRIARAAAAHDFPVNVLFWGNLDVGTALIDRHPNTRFIIDHLGIVQPHVPPAPPQPWADLPKVLELARRPNAVIKVSGACTLSQRPYPFPDIWDPLARVFDAWGFDRCLWGTDWTRAYAVVNFEQAVEPFLKTDRLIGTERAMLMGGACAKAYGWSPRKA